MSYQTMLEEVQAEVQPHFGKGKVADYIPMLASVPANRFGMAIQTIDGECYSIGDSEEAFSIQSISKVFSLMLSLNRNGDFLWTRVGKEPSGQPFNSLLLLELEGGFPRNPFINAGALVVTDSLIQKRVSTKNLILDYVSMLSQNWSIRYDQAVAESELDHADNNAALAYFMKSHGMIRNDVDKLLDVYCHQCSLSMNCVDLARAFLPLAAWGESPLVGETILTRRQTRRINALMMTCGTYDSVGNFAFRVGLPAKSGVGGGIVAIVPGRMSIAVWSPELDQSGNSCVGTVALELFTRMSGLSIF